MVAFSYSMVAYRSDFGALEVDLIAFKGRLVALNHYMDFLKSK